MIERDDKAADPGPGAVWLAAAMCLDADGRVVDCNPGAERLFGYARHELLGRDGSLLLPRLADLVPVSGDLAQSRLAFLCHCGFPFVGVRRGGERFLGAVSVTAVGEPDGALRLIVHELTGDAAAGFAP